MAGDNNYQVASGFEGGIEAAAVGSYLPDIEEPSITIALTAVGDDKSVLKTALQQIEESHPDGTLSKWFFKETTLHQEFETKAKSYPSDHRWYVDNSFLKNDVDVVEVLEQAFTTLPSRTSLVLWNTMIPRSKRELPNMAFCLQSDHYFAIYSVCELDYEYPDCVFWVWKVMAEVDKHEVGAYLGEFDLEARPAKVRGDEQTKRLMEVTVKWDYKGRFCEILRKLN